MPATPLILSIDTSAAHCAAALLSGDHLLAQVFVPMAKGQAERLIPLVQGVLAQGGATPQDLDAIGVGTGPGNFTGIRIAVSAARGLALALDIPAIGVSIPDALAHGLPHPVLISIAAPRDQVYLQRFGTDPRGPDMVAMDELADWGAPGLSVTGHAAADIASALGATALPAQPVAPAIARIAASRLHLPNPRPAPIYLRPADAAPARAQGIVMLP